MSPQKEKKLGVLSFIVVLFTAVLLFAVTPEKLGDAVSVEYILKVLLYPSALILLRAIWKTLLDNKIQGKEQRDDKFRKTNEAMQRKMREENEH